MKRIIGTVFLHVFSFGKHLLSNLPVTYFSMLLYLGLLEDISPAGFVIFAFLLVVFMEEQELIIRRRDKELFYSMWEEKRETLPDGTTKTTFYRRGGG